MPKDTLLIRDKNRLKQVNKFLIGVDTTFKLFVVTNPKPDYSFPPPHHNLNQVLNSVAEFRNNAYELRGSMWTLVR